MWEVGCRRGREGGGHSLCHIGSRFSYSLFACITCWVECCAVVPGHTQHE